MVTTVVDSSVTTGRHRFGRTGSVWVRTMTAVSERSVLARLFGLGRRWGRHHAESVVTAAADHEQQARHLTAATLA